MTALNPAKRPLYEPLGPGQIRVLKLEGTCLAGEEGQTARDLAIKCSLRTVELSDVKSGLIKYGALSYVWGTKRWMRPVSCNGYERLITGNLYNALWKFTLESGSAPDLLWIDALCIDQEDDSDRSHQVALMGSIYQEADLVIVWLGSGVDVLNESLDRVWTEMLTGAQEGDASFNDQQRVDDSIVWPAFEWFKRMWTLQEIVLARRAEVHWGPYSTSWDEFAGYSSRERFWPTRRRLEQIQALRQSSIERTLRRLLLATLDRTASDPLDQLYGLLGLWKGEGPLVPDYTCTLEHAYDNAIESIILEERIVDIHHTIFILTLEREEMHSWAKLRRVEPTLSWLWHTPENLDWSIQNSSHWKWRGSRPHRIELDQFLQPRLESASDPFRLVVSGAILGWWIEDPFQGDDANLSESFMIPEVRYDIGYIHKLPACFTGLTTDAKFDSAHTLDACVRASSATDGDHNSRVVFEHAKAHNYRVCSCWLGYSRLKSALKTRRHRRDIQSPQIVYFLCLLFGFPYALIVSYDERPGCENATRLNHQLGEKHHWQVTLWNGLYRDLSNPLPNPDLYIDGKPRARGELNWIPAKFNIIPEYNRSDKPRANIIPEDT